MAFPAALLSDLYRHMEWADATVWSVVRALPAAGGDQRLKVLLYHIHNVQHAFLSVWRGEPPRYREAEEFASLAEIESWAREYYPRASAEVAAMRDDALAQVVTLPWAGMLTEYLGHPPADTTLGETVFQVTSHTTYHRGQINARIREIGGEPPLVDYIAWIWMGRPAPVWQAPRQA